MLPEVFECPECERQFVIELIDGDGDSSIHCPQCKRYLGEHDIHYIIRTEIEELSERIRFERDRLEKDEAIFGLGEVSEPELKRYGAEVHQIVNILRKTLSELDALKTKFD